MRLSREFGGALCGWMARCSLFGWGISKGVVGVLSCCFYFRNFLDGGISKGVVGVLGADGNSGQPFPTQTGQRSGELTANCN